VIKTIAGKPLFHLLFLTAIVWLIFARTLSSYFLADDFGEIYYVNTIYNGDYGLIWLNFTSNFMSVPGMSVWRPWLLISILIDFIVWKANPVGFYLTNVLSYNAVVLLLYWLMRQLTSKTSVVKSSLVGILTAIMFAVSPLHCESVSWVVGRVDIVCAVFYLLCLNLFIKSEVAQSKGNRKLSTILTTASIISWWIAMWTKEMAIGAPMMAAAVAFLFSQQPGNFKYAVKQSLPLWISTAVYFVLRYLALGTLLGGYTQGIGDSQAANALLHWLDPDTLRRLFFPFVYSLYGQNQAPAMALAICYTVMLTTIALNAFSLKINCKWLTLLFVWTATCLAPLYKLWGLGYELEGARFCFFLTMPLAAAVPVLLLIDQKERTLAQSTTLAPSRELSLRVIGLTALVIAAVILGKTATRTNLEWVHAGKEVRKFLSQVRELDSKVKAQNQEAIVLGIPKRHGGAHMILNASTLTKGLSPPFTSENHSGHILTFDPLFFSENFPLDVSRFRKLVAEGKQIAYWDAEQSQLRQISLEPSRPLPAFKLGSSNASTSNTIQGYPHSLKRVRQTASKASQPLIVDICEGDGLSFSKLNLSPLSADYLECSLNLKPAPGAKDATFTVNFDEFSNDSSKLSASQLKLKLEGADRVEHLVRIPLSSNWRWFTKRIDNLFLELPPGSEVEVRSLNLRRADEVQPSVIAEGAKQSNEGFYFVDDKQQLHLRAQLPHLGANQKIAKLAIRITAPNAFLDNFSNSDDAIEQTVRYDLKSMTNNAIVLSLDLSKLTRDNYRQIQVQCLDINDRQLGERSDPITIKLSK